jgi:hypothetical protein
MSTTTTTKVARIFEDVGGFFICCDSLPYLDTRGRAYPTRRAAISSLRYSNDFCPEKAFTHYLSHGRKVKL